MLPLPPAPAAPPAPIAPAAALIQRHGQPLAGGRASGGALLPLERAEGGDTPVLPFETAAGPVRLLFDTGASSTMVTPALARRLALVGKPLAGGAAVLTGGGGDCAPAEPRRVSLPLLTLAGLRLEGVEALLLPIAALPPGVDGVLGVPSLRRLPVWVDPRGGRLALGPPALRAAAAAGAPVLQLPLRLRHGVPLLELRGPAGPIPALADSGAEGLFLSPTLAGSLPPLGPLAPLRLVGVCGEQAVQRRPFAGLGLPGEPAAGSERPLEGIITANPIYRQLGVEAIAGQELLRHRPQLWRLDTALPRLLLW
ncbi:MAG: retropepsin-like aspartic protease [Synechococcaceae cyanobacterium]|nr:retropepsin-like aspartic protease [Synechococcaceae cyanobacterium]